MLYNYAFCITMYAPRSKADDDVFGESLQDKVQDRDDGEDVDAVADMTRDDDAEPSAASGIAEQEDDGGNETLNTTFDDEDPMTVAWECLEAARCILEKEDAASELLAKVHRLLADCSYDEGSFFRFDPHQSRAIRPSCHRLHEVVADSCRSPSSRPQGPS